MKSIVYLNGKFVSEDQATVPVTDRGFLFGDGVFTTLKVVDGLPQQFQLHCKRLQEQCGILKIKPPEFSPNIVQELIARNNASTGSWRLKIIITGGTEPQLALPARSYGQFLMILKPYVETKEEYRLTLYPESISNPFNKIKSLSYLDRLRLADFAIQKGFDDTLVTDPQGNILETSFSNIFWRLGNSLFIPDEKLFSLDGISLQTVCSVAEELKMTLSKVQCKVDNIPSNAQVYLCSSLKGIKPVIAIDTVLFTRDYNWERAFTNAYKTKLF